MSDKNKFSFFKPKKTNTVLSANNTFENSFNEYKEKCEYTVALCGNPNVGKSTIFNSLTGLHQHTGNWPGKTVANACGVATYKDKNILLVDLPGTYSLQSNSEEEEIARNYICFGKSDAICIVVDATCLERNLNLVYQAMEITDKIVLCVNLLDEANRKGISVNLPLLEKELGIPVVGTIAHKKKTLKNLTKTIYNVCAGNVIPKPNLPFYPTEIENLIYKISINLNPNIPEDKKYLTRWIALKLLDNDDIIVNSIDSNIIKGGLKNDKKLTSIINDSIEILSNMRI